MILSLLAAIVAFAVEGETIMTHNFGHMNSYDVGLFVAVSLIIDISLIVYLIKYHGVFHGAIDALFTLVSIGIVELVIYSDPVDKDRPIQDLAVTLIILVMSILVFQIHVWYAAKNRKQH